MTVIESIGSTTNCVWSYKEDMDAWETNCGNAFVIVEGSPIDNDMAFCPYCGKSLFTDLGQIEANDL